jgi:hypothetical protein
MSMLRALRGKIVDIPNYDFRGLNGPFGRRLCEVPKSFTYMEQCWFEAFYEVSQAMIEKDIRCRQGLIHEAYCRIMEDGYDEEDEEDERRR